MDKYIWISALETSADIHGKRVMESLRRLGCTSKFLGIGGPNMAAAGMDLVFDAEQFSVMGLFEVISHIPRVFKAYKHIKKIFTDINIEKVILIDAPDFHFKIAKIAREKNIPVYYYISPQVWAWRKGRIKFLKKYVKKLLCIFPFEKEFYRQNGLDVEYVGHPLMEYLDFQHLDKIVRENNSIILLPGSRIKEVQKILPIMSLSCDILKKSFDIQIKIVKAPHISEKIINKSWLSNLEYRLVDFEDRYIEMAKSRVGIVASGTASLECGLIGLPSVVVYKVSYPTYIIGRLFVNTNFIKFISMTNIMLNKPVFPELIQHDFTPNNVVNILSKWLSNEEEIFKIKKELATLRDKFGDSQASLEAAKIIMGNS